MEAEKRTKNVTIYATETATVMPSNSQPVLGGVKSGTTRKATTQTTVVVMVGTGNADDNACYIKLSHVADAKTSHGAPSEYPTCGDQPPSEPPSPPSPPPPSPSPPPPSPSPPPPSPSPPPPSPSLPPPLRRLRLPMRPIQWGRWSKELVVTTTSTRMRSLAELDFTRVRGPTGGITVARCVQRSTPTGYPSDTIYFQFLDDYSGDTSECVTNAECHDLCRRWDPCRGYEIKVHSTLTRRCELWIRPNWRQFARLVPNRIRGRQPGTRQIPAQPMLAR